MIDLQTLTIKKAHEAMKRGDFSAVDLTKSYLKVIADKNKDLNIYLEVFEKDALDQAEAADQMFKNNTAVEMTGIPIALKDNILYEGHTVSAGSKILETYKATYDSTVVTKLKKAGAVILGRTNMDEFAMGVSTENSAYGVTKNPHDTKRVPGGSSGGSTAAVAIDSTLVALGSDTGGSCRQPAAFCGVVGFKPTYGTISRHGLIAMGSSLDIIGPITKSVADAEILFDSLKGIDPLDSTSIENIPLKKREASKITIGIPRDFLDIGIDARILTNFNESVEKLKSLGYEIKDVVLPNVQYTVPVYYIISPAEVSSNLARFDGVKYGLHVDGGNNLLADYLKSRGGGFGPEVKRRIILGTYVLSSGYYDAYYNKAMIVRGLITEDYKKAFEGVDVILTPTTTGPAFKIGEKVNDPIKMYLEDIFTGPANIVGLPALSVPSGFVEEEGSKLPLGIQFMAPHNCENLLFEIGKKFLNE